MSLSLRVGARGSRLSQVQVQEVLAELLKFHPVQFEPIWVATRGDCDKKTSLRHLEKTDFFTDEIDRRQLAGEFRISIHSAKDLPSPLHPDLEIIALTKGVDPSDSLVVKEFPLQQSARIGTSSLRREAFLKAWRPDLITIDVRGTIDERLQLLDNGTIDGIVMAEAAIIRLEEMHRPRIRLEAEVALLQGRLAVVARKNDTEMQNLFKCINAP